MFPLSAVPSPGVATSCLGRAQKRFSPRHTLIAAGITALASVPCMVPSAARAAPPSAAPSRATDRLASPELRSLRSFERELFHSATPWTARADRDRTGAFGMPDAFSSDVPPERADRPYEAHDLSFLRGLKPPNIPVHWDGRVIDYLRFFKNSPRGRELALSWLRRRERYGPMIRRILAEHSLPSDLEYVAMIESGYDPVARSRADARGLWQFVKTSGQFYGLRIDRWVDERLDAESATRAAARFLRELHHSLHSWELSFAAYNMGYGGLLRTLRKYNTNDYWRLATLEAGLPFETSVYVAKIMAMAVVGNNLKEFGFDAVEEVEPAPQAKRVTVAAGTPLRAVARAAQVPLADLKALNPQILKGRAPPGAETSEINLPAESYEGFAHRFASQRQPEQYVSYRLRFGESLELVARERRVSPGELRQLNELPAGAAVGPGTLLLVPARPRRAAPPAGEARPVAAVPPRTFHYADRRRVFYRVHPRDTLRGIASFFDVREDEITSWNHLDEGVALPSELMLQLFVPRDLELTSQVVLTPDRVQILDVGSDAYFAFHESQRGRARVRYRVQPGDTVARLAKRFQLSQGSIARINQFSASRPLEPDEWIVLYIPDNRVNKLRAKGLIEGFVPPPRPDGAEPSAASPAPDPEKAGRGQPQEQRSSP